MDELRDEFAKAHEELWDKYFKIKRIVKSLQPAHDVLEATVKSFNESLETQTKKFTSLEADLRQELDATSQKCASLEIEVKKLSDALSSLSNDQGEIDNQLQDAFERSLGNEDRITSMMSEIEHLKKCVPAPDVQTTPLPPNPPVALVPPYKQPNPTSHIVLPKEPQTPSTKEEQSVPKTLTQPSQAGAKEYNPPMLLYTQFPRENLTPNMETLTLPKKFAFVSSNHLRTMEETETPQSSPTSLQ